MKLALGVAPVVKMLAAGVPVSLGTDSCAVNDDMNMFEAARIGHVPAAHRQHGSCAVSAYAGLEMATIGGARALGMQDQIGSLEPGKKADLILVSLERAHMRPVNNIVNILVYSAGHGDVDTVIVDGEVLVAGGWLQRCDEEQVIAEAETFALERFAAAGLDRPPILHGGIPGMKLQGKVSMVTGGGSGMGRAVALLLASEGARVMIADLDPRGAEETLRLARIGRATKCVSCRLMSAKRRRSRGLVAQTESGSGRAGYSGQLRRADGAPGR